jgi:hypothetical protein
MAPIMAVAQSIEMLRAASPVTRDCQFDMLPETIDYKENQTRNSGSAIWVPCRVVDYLGVSKVLDQSQHGGKSRQKPPRIWSGFSKT